MTYRYNLGMALMPTARHQAHLFQLVERLDARLTLAFTARPFVTIPHVSLFQGRYSQEGRSRVLEQSALLDLRSMADPQVLTGLSLWAGKIVFLELQPNSALLHLHRHIFQHFGPLSEGRSADPQVFFGISDGQRASFESTGYPFSGDEYLPHFTLAHLDAVPSAAREQQVTTLLHDVWGESSLSEVQFESFAVVAVGPLGVVEKIILERPIRAA